MRTAKAATRTTLRFKAPILYPCGHLRQVDLSFSSDTAIGSRISWLLRFLRGEPGDNPCPCEGS